jgi:two-component system, OmpR family, phosphate regulon sensor histidine kinase PhoR
MAEPLTSLRNAPLADSGYFPAIPEECRVKVGWRSWLTLGAVPSLLCGLPAAVVSAVMYSAWQPAIFTLGGCVSGLLVSMWLWRRKAAEAEALLRRLDLLDISLPHTGPFHGVVHAATYQVRRVSAEWRRATDQRTRSEAKSHLLRNLVRRLEQTLEQLEQPAFIFDADETLVYHNGSADRLMSQVAGGGAQFPALAWQQLVGLKSLITTTRSRAAASTHTTGDLSFLCGKEEVPYRARVSNLYDDDGRVTGLAAVLDDIRVESTERNRQAEFVSSVSHELKTPLASIRAYTELMMDGDVEDPEERLELLKFIDDQVTRLTRMVNNLLNIARVESGVIKVQREDVDLNQVLRKSLFVVASAANEKQITMIEELSELYLPAHVDLDLFSQAIINLLSNAIKYTPQGGEVRLRSRMEETRAVIEIQDNGMGIPSESLPKLFERFYRVPQNNKAAAGTGLGLALVKYIVTNIHDGAITVASQVNQGSCFSVRVPLGHRERRTRSAEQSVVRA